MTDLLSEVEYGRILGSFTAVAEDFEGTVAPDAIPLTGRVTFVPSRPHITYINSAGETASLYVSPVNAVISQGRIVGRDGKDGVVLLASNSNNVSASVLWNARISLDPVHPGDEAPETHDFLIEVRRGEVASLIDVIKENSRVHNIALFHDAIAEAAAKFWERVESGEFRGNQGPPGPPGVGIGVAGPAGLPGKSGKDGAPGVGGNLLPDGSLEEPGFLVSGDIQESSDAVNGNKAVTFSKATSRKIYIEPEKSYVGSVYVKSAESATVSISQRVFGAEGDIDRVIENSYDVPANTWKKLTFLLDTNVGDQSMEIITQADGRTITVDQYTLSDNSVVKGLQKELTSAKALLEGRLAQLDTELAEVDSERQRLATSLNDLATVLEDGTVDLTELNEDMASLKEDLAAEQTARQEADAAAQRVLERLDASVAQAKTDLAANMELLGNLDTELETSKQEITTIAQNISNLETVILPQLENTLREADEEATRQITDLEDQLGVAQGVLESAFPNGPINVEAELANTIYRSDVQYAVSTSETVPPSDGWSSASPVREPGAFIWFRTVITYGDGTTGTSGAALMTGNTGARGEDGAQGEKGADGTSVKILGTKENVGSLPSSGNSVGDGWLVDGYLHTWAGSSWQNVGLIRGPQGIKGEDGSDGQPNFTWIKYADTSTGLGMSDDPSGKRYIGLAFNKNTQTESSTATDYQWTLFEGPEGPAGVPGDKGDKGDTGSQGVGISSITPYFRDVSRGSTAPAVPTTANPVGWSVSEPAWAPNRDLYRVEKVTYTSGAFAYTSVTKVAAYAGIDAAMAAANGKNLNTYTEVPSASRPGPAPAANSARTVGDIHRNRDSSTGEIFAEYQWNGTAWMSVSFGDSVLSSLDVGKVTGGTGAFQQFFAEKLIADNATVNKLWTDQLVGRTASFNSLTVAPGNIVPDPQGLVKETRDLLGGSPWSWVTADGGYWERAAAPGATTQFNAYLATPGILAYNSSPVTPGAEYRISYDVWVDGTSSSTTNRARAAINYRKTGGTTSFVGDGSGDGDPDDTGDSVATGKWVHVERTWIAPDDAVSAGFSFQLVNTGSDATVVRIRNPYVGVKAGAVSIENGAIGANKINAESVAAAVGRFVKVEAGNIVAGSANIDSLVAQKIAASTASFQKVNAGNIVSSSATMDQAVINQIWADGIAAKALTTNKLVVATGNLIPDGDEMATEEQWGGLTRDLDDKPAAAIAARKTTSGQGNYNTRGSQTFPVTPGQEYSVQMWVKADKPGSVLYVEMRDAVTGAHGGTGTLTDPETASTTPYFLFSRREVPTEWTLFRGTWTANDGVTSARLGTFYFNHSAGSVRDAVISIAGISMKPKVGSVLIENGAVSADHISSDSIDTAHLRANAVSAEKILAGAVTTDKMTANSINGDRIRANTLDADKITANTITATQIKAGAISATEIASRTITADRIVAGTITANEIKSRTITAAEIAAGTITANELKAESITADRMSAQALTVIGQTVVNDINVKGKLIGKDGVFTGTVDFTNVNVTGTQIVNKLGANSITADKIKGGSFAGNTFSGGTFEGSEFIGATYATSTHPVRNGGVMIDPTNGLRTWSSAGKITVQIHPNSGQIMLSDYLKAVNYTGRGVMLVPTTSTGGGGLWFSHTGSASGSDAAVWRSGYDPDGVEPLNMRGANGGPVEVYGGLGVYSGGIMALQGTSNFRDMIHTNPPTTSAGANALIATSPAGRFYRSTSSRRYKKNIVDWSPGKERVLALQPRQWQHDDPSQPEEIDETWHVGFVAEEVHDLGLERLVKYTGDGKGGWIPDGLNYDRFAAAHQVVLRDHESRIKSLENIIESLMEELKDLRSNM